MFCRFGFFSNVSLILLPQVPAEPTPPSSRMGVGAIQQLASPQQISRSMTSRAAPPQQDNLDGFSRNMPFPSAFLSTPPATQEIPSTRGKLHYVLIRVTSTNPSSLAVSARTQGPQQRVSPILPVTREARHIAPESFPSSGVMQWNSHGRYTHG
jgi:hypothetical protein